MSKIYPPMTPKSSNSNIASRNGGDTSSSSHDGNSYKDLLFFAQAAYSRREYELALSQLTLALSIITREPLAEMLGVLDTRAAAYEKLGGAKNLKLALRDARKMMTTFPSSPKGYLRAAKVLQLMGLFDAALDIYDRGLRKLEGEKDGVRVLTAMREKLVVRLKILESRRYVDPLTKLPYELVDMVFQHLQFKSLVILQRVSRGWRQFLILYHRSYSTLDFTLATRKVSSATIKSYLQRARGAVAKIVVDQSAHLALDKLQYLIRSCKNLSELHITNYEIGTLFSRGMAAAETLTRLEIGPKTKINQHDVGKIIKYGKKLVWLRCCVVLPSMYFEYTDIEPRAIQTLDLRWDMDSIISMEINTPFQTLWPRFDKFLSLLPDLRELVLVNLRADLFELPSNPVLTEITSLEKLVIRHMNLWAPIAVPKSLKYLDISNNRNMRCDKDFTLPPDLEHLSVNGSSKINNQQLLLWLQEVTTLRYLDIGMCVKINACSLDWLLDAGHGKKLEFLSLRGNQTFGDQITKELGRLVELKWLDVGNTRISGIGVVNIINRRDSKLRWLGLDNCVAVGRDAIDLVLARGEIGRASC